MGSTRKQKSGANQRKGAGQRTNGRNGAKSRTKLQIVRPDGECHNKTKTQELAQSLDVQGDDEGNEGRRSAAEKAVDLALNRYRIGRTDNGEAFAVENKGPNIALMLSGSSQAFRSALARDYRRVHGKVLGNAALADAMTTLQGEAAEKESEQVYLRVAEYEGKLVIDIGDTGGRAIMVSPGAWEVVDRSPVLFRRTAATGELPMPERGGDLQELRRLLNVTDATWPLVRGWLAAALIPNMPHPILLLGVNKAREKRALRKR
jgi:hypothetical protein